MKQHVLAALKWPFSLRHIALVAVIYYTASAHKDLAILAGTNPAVAPAVPVSIDAYVLAAFRSWERDPRRRADLFWALGLDSLAVAGSHVADQLQIDHFTKAVMAGVLGVVMVLVLWRVHALEAKTEAKTPPPPPRSRPKPKPKDPAPPVEEPKVIELPVQGPQPSEDPDEEPKTRRARTYLPPEREAEIEAWVLEQGFTRPRKDVVAEGVDRFDLSDTTIKRRYDKVKREQTSVR